MSTKHRLLLALDRTAVLFIGLAVGGIVGASFSTSTAPPEAQASTPAPQLASAVTPPAAAATTLATEPGARLLRTAAEGGTVHVGVFGDSFGDGVWAGLYEQLPSADGIEVHKLSRQATGFTRYRTTDLLEDTRHRLAAQPVDIAVLSFGANDTQGIFYEGHGSEFMSERWQQIVSERVGAIVALLRQHGAMVYWVGLPTMRDPAYNAQIRQMNAFYAERMRALGVPYVETAQQTMGPNGQYEPYMRSPRTGERFMARVNDGIHMTIPGYLVITRTLSEQIRQTVAQARVRAGRGAPVRNAGQRPGGDRQSI
jgi:uncharacterized protein